MTLDDLCAALDALDVPWCNTAWESGEAPPLPYIVIVGDDSESVYADDGNYYDFADYRIELYSRSRDYSMEKQIKRMLRDNDCGYEYYCTYINAEHMHMTAFDITIEEDI